MIHRWVPEIAIACFALLLGATVLAQSGAIGREISVPRHLAEGDEHSLSPAELLAHGQNLFSAIWTTQEGAGRPQTKGTGAPLADGGSPLTFPRNFNRVSGPDANSCAGCHNSPFGVIGGSGDIVTNVFVLGQRFDFVTLDSADFFPTRGSVGENGLPSTVQNVGNSRKTVGMFGAGYIEMLARQITVDLRTIRDRLAPGTAAQLVSKGISFGTLVRNGDGTWNTSGVTGLPAPSLVIQGAQPPSLIIRPFHQAGAVISLRQFTNNAFNHHHGIQSAERFGFGVDADGDGFVNELTRADVTAASVFQAAMAVPGRVIPDDPVIEQAVRTGEARFGAIGCTSCHIPALPLNGEGRIYTEPNPFNPQGNARLGEMQSLSLDLSDKDLPAPRLQPVNGVV